MKNIHLPKFILICLLLGSLIFSNHQPAHAQTAGRGITIIPPKFELFANPGDNISDNIRVRNESDAPVTYGVVVEDFLSSGEEGHVVLEEEGNQSSFTLAQWISPSEKDIVLQPHEERILGFNITVPKDAEPGGHYASVLFQVGGVVTPGSAAVNQRVGSLVLLRVSGNVSEDSQIETFEAPKYSQKGPITFDLRLKNNGNVHIRPKGTIVITNILGKKVEEIPLRGANVLPGATRKMDTVWEKQNLIGYYTATLVATYGQQNLPLTAATKFTVISTTAAILLVVGGFAAILFLVSLFTGRNKLLKAFKALTSD